MTRAFEDLITVPEQKGTVMVIEKEFGLAGARDWASIASGLVDIVKCTFGTAALYDKDILKKKIEIYKDAGISPMIGGTLTEVAILGLGNYKDTTMRPYLRYAKSLGFTHLEFSDGTIYVPDDKRADIIRAFIEEGFTVLSEVGKKDPKKDSSITVQQRIELMEKDIESGAMLVIIEARESGKGVGVMDKSGQVNFEELDTIIQAVGKQKIMIEAPEKNQQQAIFLRYGPDANVGNVQPRDALSVCALRSGLRGDTISALRKEDWTKYHNWTNAPQEYRI